MPRSQCLSVRDLLDADCGNACASLLLGQVRNHFGQPMSRRFSPIVSKKFKSAGFRPTLITIPAGEKSKTLEQAGAICDQMIAAGLDRQSFVVGLGGGMIGDHFGIRGGDLSPRHSAHSNSNDAAGHGGQLDRRQNRCRYARREKFDRRFPSTLAGD